MLCPECHAPLFGENIDRCPACGRSLKPRDRAPTDDDGSAADRTMQSDEFADDPAPAASRDSSHETTDSSQTYLSDEIADDAEGRESAQTYLSDEVSAMSIDGPRPVADSPYTSDIRFDSQDDDPPGTISFASPKTGDPSSSAPQHTVGFDEEPRHTGDTNVDATYISDEWPEHEGVEPTKKTRAAGPGDPGGSNADASSQTMSSEDFQNASEDGGFVVVTQGNSSQSADGSYQTFLSDDGGHPGGTAESSQTYLSKDDEDIRASEMKTMQSNFGDVSGDQPAVTLKSHEPKSSRGSESVRGTLDTVPRRSMRSGDTPQITRPDYELIKILGEGGMGVVWTARQTSVDRSVAVKMIKGPAASNRTQRQKFLAEAVVTGDLDHPNIVPIYDVGTDSKGILFYSMKQVEGTPWLKVLKKKTLPENLEILLRTADAVAFAHSRGIIHRDLKPENVMLGSFGEVLVMDWGLALPTEKFQKGRDISLPGMGGTPAYMAPEMATGPLDRITYSSDIYLLGAMLFELVTNKAPHPGKKVQECLLNAMRNVLSETDKSGELIDIAKKAMATNPLDRYLTVQEFQQALRDYLSHSESIAMAVRAEEDLDLARKSKEYTAFNKAVFGYEEALELWPANTQASAGVQTAKLAYAQTALDKGDFDLGLSLATSADPAHMAIRKQLKAGLEERDARKRRLQAAKRLMGVMAAAIFLIVSVSFFWIQSERNFAITQRDEAKKQEGIAKEQTAIAQTERDNARTQEQIATEQKVIATRERDNADAQKKIATEQRDEAKKQEKIATQQTLIAKTERDNAQTQQKIAQEQRDEAKKQEMLAVAQKKLADEQRLLADQKRKEADEQRALAVSAKEAEEYEAYIARIGLAAAKIDENAFDVAESLLDQCKPELRNWEWGRLMHLCRQASRELAVDGPVDSVAVSPDGTRIATGSWDRQARIWNAATGELERAIPHPDLYVHGVAWSPDGKTLATAGSAKDRYVHLWNAATGDLIATLPGHTDTAVSVTFSDNGKWLVSTSYDETARLWDVTDLAHPKEAAVLRDHTWWVWNSALSPGFDPASETGTNAIVTVSQDGKAVIWKVSPKSADANAVEVAVESVGRFTAHAGPVYGVAFHPNGKTVATAGYDRRVLLWNPADVPAFSFADSEKLKAVKVRELEGHTAPVQSVSFSKDGALLVSGCRDNAVKVWSVEQGKSIKTLRGHSSGVRSAVFTPDGRTVVSGSQDQRVRLWGVEGYEEFRVLEGRTLAGHTDAILGASFSPNGKQILTASRDRSARSWDALTGQPLQTFREGHDYLASNAVLFPDGRTLVTAAADNTVRFWDIATGTQFLRLPGTGWSAALTLSADGRWLVTGSDGETARLWDLRDIDRDTDESRVPALPRSTELTGHNGRVSAVAFSPTENVVLTGDTNGRCLLHRIADDGKSETLWNVHHHTRRITGLRFLAGGQILSASSDHTVGRIDQKTGAEIDGLVLKHAGAVTALSVSKDGTRIATVSDLDAEADAFEEGSRLTVFETATARPVKTLNVADFTVTSIDFGPEGTSLLAACSDNTVRVITPEAPLPIADPLIDFGARGGLVWSARFTADARSIVTIGGSDARLWDAVTAKESMTFSPHGAVASARFSPDGSKVVTGSWDNSAKIWQADSGQALRKLEHGHDGYINATVYSPDGTHILTASDDGSAKLWNVATGQVVRTLTGHKDRVRSAAFSRDGRFILTTSNDKTARLWNAASGEQVGEPFVGHKWAVLSGQFAPDGTTIITGGEDNEARLWDVTTRETRAVLKGHTAAVTSVAFSQDGKRAFTASQDNTAKLWDATNKQSKEILTLKGHSQEVTSVTFSPDGRQVLTASRDGKAIVWLTSDWTAAPTPVAQAPYRFDRSAAGR